MRSSERSVWRRPSVAPVPEVEMFQLQHALEAFASALRSLHDRIGLTDISAVTTAAAAAANNNNNGGGGANDGSPADDTPSSNGGGVPPSKPQQKRQTNVYVHSPLMVDAGLDVSSIEREDPPPPAPPNVPAARATATTSSSSSSPQDAGSQPPPPKPLTSFSQVVHQNPSQSFTEAEDGRRAATAAGGGGGGGLAATAGSYNGMSGRHLRSRIDEYLSGVRADIVDARDAEARGLAVDDVLQQFRSLLLLTEELCAALLSTGGTAAAGGGGGAAAAAGGNGLSVVLSRRRRNSDSRLNLGRSRSQHLPLPNSNNAAASGAGAEEAAGPARHGSGSSGNSSIGGARQRLSLGGASFVRTARLDNDASQSCSLDASAQSCGGLGSGAVAYDMINQYYLLHALGSGSTGTAYLVMDSVTNVSYALKSVRRAKQPRRLMYQLPQQLAGSTSQPNEFSCDLLGDTPRPAMPREAQQPVEKEIRIMRRLKHPNIVRLREVIDDEEEGLTYLVMSCAARGPVAHASPYDPARGFAPCSVVRPLRRLARYARQLTAALNYMHAQRVVHNDLKPDNVLLDEQDNIVIIDFGESILMPRQVNPRRDVEVSIIRRTASFCSDASLEGVGPDGKIRGRAPAGTPAFAAPELVEHSTCSPKSDAWSVGVLLYSMLFGQLPFAAVSQAATYDAVLHAPLVVPPLADVPEADGLTPEAYDAWVAAIRGLLHRAPEHRTALPDLLQAPALAAPPAGDGDSADSSVSGDGGATAYGDDDIDEDVIDFAVIESRPISRGGSGTDSPPPATATTRGPVDPTADDRSGRAPSVPESAVPPRRSPRPPPDALQVAALSRDLPAAAIGPSPSNYSNGTIDAPSTVFPTLGFGQSAVRPRPPRINMVTGGDKGGVMRPPSSPPSVSQFSIQSTHMLQGSSTTPTYQRRPATQQSRASNPTRVTSSPAPGVSGAETSSTLPSDIFAFLTGNNGNNNNSNALGSSASHSRNNSRTNSREGPASAGVGGRSVNNISVGGVCYSIQSLASDYGVPQTPVAREGPAHIGGGGGDGDRGKLDKSSSAVSNGVSASGSSPGGGGGGGGGGTTASTSASAAASSGRTVRGALRTGSATTHSSRRAPPLTASSSNGTTKKSKKNRDDFSGLTPTLSTSRQSSALPKRKK